MFEAMLRTGRLSKPLGAAGGHDRPARAACPAVRRVAGDSYLWDWPPGDMDWWSLRLTAERHLAPSAIRAHQWTLLLFSGFLADGRYGWAMACEEEFGPVGSRRRSTMSRTSSRT
jgi:integrase/recombinase XerC